MGMQSNPGGKTLNLVEIEARLERMEREFFAGKTAKEWDENEARRAQATAERSASPPSQRDT